MISQEGQAERRLVEELERKVGPSLATIALGDTSSQEGPLASKMPLRAIERVRLDVALETIQGVADAESEDVARAWFIGANVGEDDTAPYLALRDDRFDEVRSSANRLISDDYYSS